MPMLSRILVPVVFSDRCRDATRYGAALACRFHSTITLLHVFVQPWAALTVPEGYAPPPPCDVKSMIDDVQAQLTQFLSDELLHLPVRREVSDGDPARMIVEYARADKSDLIVMPTHGYGPFRRFLLGSVTAKVLHDAPCPVLTGPHLENPPGPMQPSFHKVLCAVDFGPETRHVLDWGFGFAREFGSEVAVVYAIPSSTVRLDSMYFDPEWRLDLAANARARISAIEDELHVKGEILVEVGDVPAAVRDAAASIHADLLVIGRGQPHGVLGRLRTNAYAILRESPCPVAAV